MAKVIETQGLGVAFGEDGAQSIVFEDLDFSVEQGEFVTLVGISGVGKSTLLRVIADLIPPVSGTVKVTPAAGGARRPIAMVFQAALLMPWRTVADNITLGLEGTEISKADRQQRLERTLELVGLTGFGDRWPYQLSGGQQQRIGIARALAVDPDILLMDEPFGALDAITRATLQDELLRIWRETGKSILFVTHDIEEAAYLGDRVLLLGGKPAHIIDQFALGTDRSGRRESAEYLRTVEDVKAGLTAETGPA